MVMVESELSVFLKVEGRLLAPGHHIGRHLKSEHPNPKQFADSPNLTDLNHF
jgi:hypothetical protein